MRPFDLVAAALASAKQTAMECNTSVGDNFLMIFNHGRMQDASIFVIDSD
jgi:hypothetical protein